MLVVRTQTYYLPLDERTGLNLIQCPSLGKSTTPILTEGICCARCMASCGFKNMPRRNLEQLEKIKIEFLLTIKATGRSEIAYIQL